MNIQNNGIVSNLLKDVKIPRMFYAKQTFNDQHIEVDQIREAIYQELSKEEFSAKIRPGMSIAITAGSRGIRNVDLITKTIVDFVKYKGADPFIVPAMGSHGGATAQGQLEILAGYHITPETMGCPIQSSMEVVYLGKSSLGKDVYMDANAYRADGTIISCRLKPHNAFRGKVESGPCKMMSVGLGKQHGASIVHSDGMNHMADNIPTMADVMIHNANILFALPCIENAYDQTLMFEAILPENIIQREEELLKIAFDNMPRLIVGETDVLVVDEIGKNYSGTGVDPNITGTFSTPYASGGIKVQRTAFLNLSEESHGNALGCGLASTITKKIYEKMDLEKMYPNCITSTVLASAMIPPIMANDKEAIQLCIKTCNQIDQSKVRIVRIPNSLHIGTIMLSESYYQDVIDHQYENLEAISDLIELEFDREGNLITTL